MREEKYVSVPLQLLKDVKVQLGYAQEVRRSNGELLKLSKELLQLSEALDNNDNYFIECNVWSDYHDKYIHEDEAYFDEEYHDWKLIE